MVDQRTEFEIGLKDSISPQLQAISKQLKEMNRLAKESGDGGSGAVDKLRKSNEGFGASAREGLKHFKEVGETIIDFGKDLLGVGGIVSSIHQVASALDDFATSRVQLKFFAQNTKFATDDISRMRGAMSRMGVDANQADQYIGGLSTKLQELRAFREGSPLFQDLEKMGSKGADAAHKLLGDVKADDYKKAVTDILDFYKQQGPEAQFYLSQKLGIPQSVLTNLKDYMKLVEDTFDGDEKATQTYLNNKVLFFGRMDSEWNKFASHALVDINKFWDDINARSGGHALSDWMIGEFDAIKKGLEQDKKDFAALKTGFETITNFWGNKPDDETMKMLDDLKRKKLGGRPFFEQDFKALDEQKKQTTESNNKLLGDISEVLKRFAQGAQANVGGSGADGGGDSGSASSGSRGGSRASGTEDNPASPVKGGQVPKAMQRDDDSVVPKPDSQKSFDERWKDRIQGGDPKAEPTTSPEVGDAGGVKAFIMHHTGGGGDVAGVQQTLRERHLGVEYVMDRKGNITKTGGPGSANIMPEDRYRRSPILGPGQPFLNNQNIAGMEVIARNDKDVTPAQVAAARAFIAKNYPNTPVFGHGEVNPGHKEADEGMSIVSAIRAQRGGKLDEAEKKNGGAITFNFNNVPRGVKTNADADGFDSVKVERSNASPSHEGASFNERFTGQ
jgi:hypothetical protein